MSGYTVGESADLYEADTGRWVGLLDSEGREQRIYAADIDALMLSDLQNQQAVFARQFSTYQRLLPTRTLVASSNSQLFLGPCAVAGVRPIVLGSSGFIQIRDGLTSSDDTQLRFKQAWNSALMTLGTYYPLVADAPSAALFGLGAFVQVTGGGGIYAIDLIDGTDLSPGAIVGTEGSGILTESAYVTASGVALAGPSSVVSIRIIENGTAGNFAVYNDTSAVAANTMYPSTLFSSLVDNQLIKLGPTNGAAGFNNLYITMPTGAIAVVNYLPR